MQLTEVPETNKGKNRVLLAISEPIVGYGLLHLINHEPDLIVCGETQQSSELVMMLEIESPDLVIVDLAWNSSGPFSLLRELKLKFPSVRLLVISRYNSTIYAHRALRVGAGAYVRKQDGISHLLVAIRQLLDAGKGFKKKMKTLQLEGPPSQETQDNHSLVASLSNRELEVFHLLGKGFTARQIAERLHVSTKTIETHRESLKRKVKATSISQLIQKAVEWSLVQTAC